MEREPRIAAMAPWHWFTRAMPTAPEFALGAKEFPRLVGRLQQLGRHLAGRGAAAAAAAAPAPALSGGVST